MSGAVGWPDTVFEAPVWRGLDPAARETVARAGRLRDVEGVLYRDGEPGEALFVVIAGVVELYATRRGDAAATLLRSARAGDSVGEEALFAGLARCASARAAAGTRVAELPAAVARRVLARRAESGQESRELRYLVRAAARDLLASSALGRDLDAAELELLLDGVALERFGRGTELIHAGDRAEHIYVVAEGLLLVQRDQTVQAYLARGDFFGDEAAFAGRPSAATVVAAGDTWCAVLPRAVVRTVADRNHGVLARWRRVADAHAVDQAALVGGAAAGSTQHAFRDLYRLQVARSLLVIDQATCVRCGHCAWSCGEVHGESRLVRRGDKVVTPVDRALGSGLLPAARPATLLLPNTCQHCRHAACLQDCPTGAMCAT
jgi:CRP-like cAMP-binding protein